MRHIDEDTITQAVIARHAAAGDARLVEVMTSLVQHLHAFARDVKLTEAEWHGGLRFLADCGRVSSGPRQELALLSDTLGLSMLVGTLNRRRPRGVTESTLPAAADAGADEHGSEPCFVRGRVRTLDGRPVAGARLRIGASAPRAAAPAETGADGSFLLAARAAPARAVVHDGPVGRMLAALGRQPWRPAHLPLTIEAPGCEPLVTQLFRSGSEHLDSDAAFAVRSSLIADWVRHEPGQTPDGAFSDVPFYCIDFDFVLHAQEPPA
jgi:hydroxyquinol 1,2-dioxygenase